MTKDQITAIAFALHKHMDSLGIMATWENNKELMIKFSNAISKSYGWGILQEHDILELERMFEDE